MNSSSHTNRTEGGVRPGSVIGVLLNLDDKSLSFFVNDVMQVRGEEREGRWRGYVWDVGVVMWVFVCIPEIACVMRVLLN